MTSMTAPRRGTPQGLNRVLLAAIFGAILWFVLTVRTTSPRTEQAPVAAPLAPVATPAPVMAPGAALSVPVAGVAPTQLMDTFTQARGSGRSPPGSIA